MRSKEGGTREPGWRQFEHFVAMLHDNGHLEVDTNVKLAGRSGTTRQIDVLLTHHSLDGPRLLIIECKHYRRRIEQRHVDALRTVVDDVGAARGIIFTAAGAQRGAIRVARHYGIEIFAIRDLRGREWPFGGRQIPVYGQLWHHALGQLQLDYLPSAAEASLPRHVLYESGASVLDRPLPLLFADGQERTLRELIHAWGVRALIETSLRGAYFHDSVVGVPEQHYVRVRAHISLQRDRRVTPTSKHIQVERVQADVWLLISQVHLQADQATAYAVACSIEDCLRRVAYRSIRPREGRTVTKPLPVESRTDGALVLVLPRVSTRRVAFAGIPHDVLATDGSEIKGLGVALTSLWAPRTFENPLSDWEFLVE